MRFSIVAITALGMAISLSGCDLNEPKIGRATVAATKQLTVTGPKADVDRFAKIQGSLKPPLTVSTIKPLHGGRAQLVVLLPDNQTGADLTARTREALAAGLSYKYEEINTTTEEK